MPSNRPAAGTPAGPVVVVEATWRDCPAGVTARYQRITPHEEADDVRIGRCLPGHFGDAALAAFVSAGPPADSQAETGTTERTVLLAADGSERAQGTTGGESWMGGPPEPKLIVDLDGDGVDELVETQSVGPAEFAVHVVHREGRDVEAITIPAEREDDDAPAGSQPSASCELDVGVGDARPHGGWLLVITATELGEMPAEAPGCTAGRWIYEIQGDRATLVQAPPGAGDGDDPGSE